MAKTSGEKIKLLLIRNYLLRHSDAEHPVSIKDITEELSRYDISAERKSIYRDLETLGCFPAEESGEIPRKDYELELVKDHGDYYISRRLFSPDEVSLLIDMVQSSNFITTRKTNALVSKLSTLVSSHQARELKRSVYVRNRVKVMDESVFNYFDTVSQAINRKLMLRFQYCSFDIHKKKQPRNGGKFYAVSPYALLWVDQRYYLLAYSEEHRQICTYRLDRMSRLSIWNRPRSGEAEFKKLDMSTYTMKVFHMYTGPLRRITLRCGLSLIDSMVDRFGSDIAFIPDGDGHFTFNVEVAVSPQFYGWVAGFGSAVEILSPTEVREGMAQHLEASLALYR